MSELTELLRNFENTKKVQKVEKLSPRDIYQNQIKLIKDYRKNTRMYIKLEFDKHRFICIWFNDDRYYTELYKGKISFTLYAYKFCTYNWNDLIKLYEPHKENV